MTNYVRLIVEIHGKSWRTPEQWRKEIDTHTRIRHDPDYEDDVVVTIDEYATDDASCGKGKKACQ